MALFSDTNKLKQLLSKHELPNVYEKLLSKGYSIDLLQECSENDIEELCRDLSLDLIHRLRLKRCLKEIGIPKQQIYTVITQKEQSIIDEMNHKLQSLQDTLPTLTNPNSDTDTKTMHQNKELINCTLDSIVAMINNKRKQILIDLSDNYRTKNTQNNRILQCFTELKQIKTNCEALFVPNKNNINFEDRYQTISGLWTLWQNTYANSEIITKININCKDMTQIRQNITALIDIAPQSVKLFQHIKQCKHNQSKVGINGLNYDEKQIDAIPIDDVIIPINIEENKSQSIGNTLISDVIDPINESLVFQHRPIRAWRMDKEQNKWRGRGRGNVSVYYNKLTATAKLIFNDEKHNKTRLLQCINGSDKCVFINDLNAEVSAEQSKGQLRWRGSDYTMDVQRPLVCEWKFKFEEESDKFLEAAKEFCTLFNQYIEEVNSKKVIANGWAYAFIADDNSKNNNGNSVWGNSNNNNGINTDNNFQSVFQTNNNSPWADSFKSKQNWFQQVKDDAFRSGEWSQSFGGNNGVEVTEVRQFEWDESETESKKWEWAGTQLKDANDTPLLTKDVMQLLLTRGEDKANLKGSKVEMINHLKEHYTVELAEPVKDLTCKELMCELKLRGLNDAHARKEVLVNRLKSTNEDNTMAHFSFAANNQNNSNDVWGNVANNIDIAQSSDAQPLKRRRDGANIGWALNAPAVQQLHSSEDNGLEFTLKPIVKLEEQMVLSGHENETMVKCIPFRVLYVFGRNVANEPCWKERARDSKIHFYKSNANHQMRIVARENETNKLRLNHNIPKNNDIASLHKKTNKTCFWNAKDVTFEADISMFCVKFNAENDCNDFYEQFNAAMNSNVWLWSRKSDNEQILDIEKGEIIEEIVEEHGIIEQAQSFSFSFKDNNDGFENISWGNTEPDFGFAQAKTDPFSFGNSDSEKHRVKDGDCPICYENPMSNPLITECAHIFCENCIKNAISLAVENERESVCPMCRKGISLQTLNSAPVSKEKPFANASFANDGGFSFKESMNIIKNSVSFAVSTDDNTGNEDNTANVTFKPLVHLEEVTVLSGHENEKLLTEFEVSKVYRWGKDVSGVPYWKTRASKTKLLFYQNVQSGQIRLVCRENITNKLRLNQWIVPMQIANIEQRSDKQIVWTGFDTTIEKEDEGSNGYCMFAAKFSDGIVTEGFLKQLKSASENNEGNNGDLEEQKEERMKANEFCENKNNTKLDEYEIEKLFIWDEGSEEWTERVSEKDMRLELYQNGANGVMIIMCRDRNNGLRLKHSIPSPKVANVNEKSNSNEIQWESCDETIENGNNKSVWTFKARFNDKDTANKFLQYFKAGSMNNSQIQVK